MRPEEALEHAERHGPSDDTRVFACKNPFYAYYYALDVDKCPREDTREAACREAKYAYEYAIKVDKEAQIDTWLAVKDTEYEREYKKIFNDSIKEQII